MKKPELSRLDKLISWVSPARGLSRVIARNRLERANMLQNTFKRGFEAVGEDRFRQDMQYTSANTDSFVSSGGVEALRNHVRYMEFQSGFFRGPISRVVNNVVGSGFQFQSRIKSSDDFQIADKAADKLNRSIEKHHGKWSKQADQRLLHHFWMMTRQIEGALIRDGEVLIVGRKSARPGRHIPYCQQVYEIDRLRTPPGEIANPNVRNGIEYDSEGVPTRYYVLKYHPGDSLLLGKKPDDYEEIPAFFENGTQKVFYLYNPIRPEQLRGFSMFGPALKALQDMDRYREAEIMAALEDACMTGIVKMEANSAAILGLAPDSDAYGNRIHEFAPNKWHYLSPGEEADIHKPSRPNSAFKEFTEQLMSEPANALDIPPEVMTQNWHDINYSNARTILLQLYMVCRIRQKFLIDYYLSPTHECVLNDLVAMGHVRAREFYSNRDEYLAHNWVAPGWEWLDPEKEANGKESEVENGFNTYSAVCAAKGMDPEENLEANARYLKLKKDLAARYGIEWPSKEKAQVKPEAEAKPAKAEPKRTEIN